MSASLNDKTVVKLNETSQTEDTYDKAILACQVIQIAILLFSIWVLLCAIIYGFKTKKWRERPGSSSLDQAKMYSCCVAAIALTLPRIIYSSVMMFVHPNITSSVCEEIVDAWHGLYFVAMYPAYFYLWLRHRAIYSHQAVQGLTGKCVVLFGWAVLLLMTVLSVVLGWAYVAPNTYTSSPSGCRISSEKGDRSSNLLVVFAALLFIGQVSLLALFIYPLVKCKMEQMKNRGESASQGTMPNGQRTKRTKLPRAFLVCRNILCGDGVRNSENNSSSLARTIRRSFYGALVAMISDIIVMVIALFGLPSSTPTRITATLYDVGILINSLCILSTFGNNRKLLKTLWSSPGEILSETTS